MSEIIGVGVIRSIDVPTGRITIAYLPIEGLNWPAGTMPFAVAKSALLDRAVPGQKVRFRLESQQIIELDPFDPAQAAPEQAETRASAPSAVYIPSLVTQAPPVDLSLPTKARR